MSKHVTEWLNAYLDGELKEGQAQQVEEHLVACQACQMELESLARLSSLLHEVPVPEFTAPERFAAQVNLRLPRQRASMPKNKALEIGWWMIPVGLLGTWVFIGTSAWVSNLLSAANSLGVLTSPSDWLALGTGSEMDWSAILGQFGVLSGNGLNWAASAEIWTRTSLPQITLQIAIAFLYLGWMAIWWARRRRQGQEQLLEG
ncbi:MAG TPA: anti-sigma factor [Anaerolineales bacterium]|nr:anti-sigma factor [Anaerolineales bacterium]